MGGGARVLWRTSFARRATGWEGPLLALRAGNGRSGVDLVANVVRGAGDGIGGTLAGAAGW